MNIFIIIGIILCIITVAVIMAICIQAKRTEENFYRNQKEHGINNECYGDFGNLEV